MDKKVSFKIARVKRKPNGSSSITIIGQPYNLINVSVNDKELHLTGDDSNQGHVDQTITNK